MRKKCHGACWNGDRTDRRRCNNCIQPGPGRTAAAGGMTDTPRRRHPLGRRHKRSTRGAAAELLGIGIPQQ